MGEFCLPMFLIILFGSLNIKVFLLVALHGCLIYLRGLAWINAATHALPFAAVICCDAVICCAAFTCDLLFPSGTHTSST